MVFSGAIYATSTTNGQYDALKVFVIILDAMIPARLQITPAFLPTNDVSSLRLFLV